MRVDSNQKKTEKINNKPLVHNIFILDCSASMFSNSMFNSLNKDGKYNAALQGINEDLILKVRKLF